MPEWVTSIGVIEPLPQRRKRDEEHVKRVISPFGTAHMSERAMEAWQWRAFRPFLSSLMDDEFAASPTCRGRSPRRVHKIANTGTIDYGIRW